MVNVPFSFAAGNSHFQAGQFSIQEANAGSNEVLLRSQEGTGVGFLFATGMMPDNASVSKPRVIFNKYGDHYFLSEIWYGDGEGGCHVLPTKEEEETAKSGTAMNQNPTVIEIAAR